MTTSKIGDLELYYEVHGTGAPVVLIAGYTCDHTFWDAMVPSLAQHFQVVVFDNRAVGRSKDDGRAFSMNTLADDAAGLIRHLGLSRPGLVGQSMGGAIVQTMLARHAEICGQCAIVNSTRSISATTLLALNTLLALRRADVDLDLQVELGLPWFAGKDWLAMPGNIEDYKDALRNHPAPQSLADQERQLHALKTFGAGAGNRPWAYPALVVSSTEDVITTPAEGKALAASLDAAYVEIPGGHLSALEKPVEVAEILAGFFSGKKDR
jgi:pimeloyl-ACP methyl ester carboxylesterase